MIADRIIRSVTVRDPDLIIGEPDRPYLKRWFVIPRNRFFNIYLHNIIRSDDDRALHDHPWWNLSIILKGAYNEIVSTPGATTTRKFRGAGSIVLRRARTAHRLEVIGRVFRLDCWTLFITGPRLRAWGFWCPSGWVHWQDFTDGPNGETVGRGCGEIT